MNKLRVLNMFLLILLLVGLVMVKPALSAPAEANALTGYYNMMGYEGIATLGYPTYTAGTRPPVKDYVSTHCQFIDIPNTTVGHYYLRFPLKLPNGSNITKVSARIADFYSGGSMWVYLRSRNWNSRDWGDTHGLTLTPVGGSGQDELVHITGLDVDVNNATKQYWIDMSPQNSTSPGQLCVYSLQVTYTIDTSLLPLIQKGY